jgi:hypothetical protein
VPATASNELWQLIDQPQIDAADLAAAIDRELARGQPDFRTRLLIRDAVNALKERWGDARVQRWLAASPAAAALRDLMNEKLGDPGFPSLGYRIVDQTKAETVLQFLRELGANVRQPTELIIGGSIALILPALLSRHTEDIDVVDEVPAQIRGQHELLEDLSKRYGLGLTHFQSHYLPSGWEKRIKPFGEFGKLRVSLVDEFDIMLGKLFSKREKDRDDLRVLAAQMDKSILQQRLETSGVKLLGEPDLRQNAADNWYILYGEKLPD